MWSTPSDRARAEAQKQREEAARQRQRTAHMTLRARFERWTEERGGEETEELVEILSDALTALEAKDLAIANARAAVLAAGRKLPPHKANLATSGELVRAAAQLAEDRR